MHNATDIAVMSVAIKYVDKNTYRNSFISTFAAVEPAKPLDNSQIGGSFFLSLRQKIKKRCASFMKHIFDLRSRCIDRLRVNRIDNIELYRIPILFQQADRIGHIVGNAEIHKHRFQGIAVMLPFVTQGM